MPLENHRAIAADPKRMGSCTDRPGSGPGPTLGSFLVDQPGVGLMVERTGFRRFVPRPNRWRILGSPPQALTIATGHTGRVAPYDRAGSTMSRRVTLLLAAMALAVTAVVTWGWRG